MKWAHFSIFTQNINATHLAMSLSKLKFPDENFSYPCTFLRNFQAKISIELFTQQNTTYDTSLNSQKAAHFVYMLTSVATRVQLTIMLLTSQKKLETFYDFCGNAILEKGRQTIMCDMSAIITTLADTLCNIQSVLNLLAFYSILTFLIMIQFLQVPSKSRFCICTDFFICIFTHICISSCISRNAELYLKPLLTDLMLMLALL